MLLESGLIIAGAKSLASAVAVKVAADQIGGLLKPEPKVVSDPEAFENGVVIALGCVGLVAVGVGVGYCLWGKGVRVPVPMA